MKFNNNFLVGAATAAHQVEGNNVNNDCWVMEQMPGSTYKEPSLDAVDHYNRYREDIKLLVDAGCNAFRFSIEWARIEPTKGNFDKKEIEHYRDVLKYCHENGVTPVVTLHHFSSPKWLMLEGGWESKSTIEFFGRYSRYVVSELGDLIPYICTINEANMGLQLAKIMKQYADSMANSSEKQPQNGDVQVGINIDMKTRMEKYYRAIGEAFGDDPRKIQPFLTPRTENGDLLIMRCHEKARKVIKEVNPNIQVGITFSIYDHQSIPGGEEFVKIEQDEDFIHYLPYIQEDDFLGVQNYSRKIYGPNGVIRPDENARLTKAGYEFYPQALGNVLKFVSKHWKKPIIVTENGISTTNDTERIEFIELAVKGMQECVEDGIPVIGYMHWSLLDNFEWQLGYDQTYGLIAVDRSSQIRYPKKSLSFLGNIKKNGI